MTAKRNHRPLATISAEIHRIERTSIVALGKLLLEAKAQLDHGKWLPFLRELEWNERTAQLYMSVAGLAAKYESVAHLKAAPTALYQLTWIADYHPKVLKVAMKRLQASVARGDKAAEQRNVVLRSPDAAVRPDLSEVALQGIHDAANQNCYGSEQRSKAMGAQVRAIAKANPSSEEALAKICAAHPVPLPKDLSPSSDIAGSAIEESKNEQLGNALAELSDYADMSNSVKEFLHDLPDDMGSADLLKIAKLLETAARQLAGGKAAKIAADRAEATRDARAKGSKAVVH